MSGIYGDVGLSALTGRDGLYLLAAHVVDVDDGLFRIRGDVEGDDALVLEGVWPVLTHAHDLNARVLYASRLLLGLLT